MHGRVDLFGHACAVALLGEVVVSTELRTALKELVSFTHLILEVNDVLVELVSDLTMLCQFIRILFVYGLERGQSLVLASHHVLERVQLSLNLLLIMVAISLALLCFSLQMSGLFLHLLLELLHFDLSFSQDLADLRRQVCLLFPEELLELFLVVSLLQLDSLDLSVELGPTLIQLLAEPLFFALQLLDMVSDIVPFFLDLNYFFAGLAGCLCLVLGEVGPGRV